MEYRCVQCGFRIKTLFVQYSPGNIRLMKCDNCRAIADEYIECEIMIPLLDLILHKPKAYRHLLYNVLNHETVNLEALLWKSTIGFHLLDACILCNLNYLLVVPYKMFSNSLSFKYKTCLYSALANPDRSLLLTRSDEEQSSSMSFSSLVWICQKMLKDVVFGNIMFLCIFLLASRTLLNTQGGVFRFRDFFLAILISSYFKIFLVAMMVWKFPSSVIFIVDLFVLSSNAVALKVHIEITSVKSFPFVTIRRLSLTVALQNLLDACMTLDESLFRFEPVITESSMIRIIGACFVAHAVKIFIVQGLELSSLRY
ncbi:hypothetical protein JRO89_XS01G0344800 [Xanthoceras sorbifolium]|uniref:Protein ARV n=1 Tax=Xanthoceras sorbifolium TaxID=99658 RepID=A0ABQ8IN56_9ROSI|nr:hypothetical protein JRO89_XS01G0344800 [Xanthoceras sorbifolium]